VARQPWEVVNGKKRPVCPVCDKPIQRNLVAVDGVYYHYGCWKRREQGPPDWLPLWICTGCGKVTSKPVEVVGMGRTCPRCGAPVRRLQKQPRVIVPSL